MCLALSAAPRRAVGTRVRLRGGKSLRGLERGSGEERRELRTVVRCCGQGRDL